MDYPDKVPSNLSIQQSSSATPTDHSLLHASLHTTALSFLKRCSSDSAPYDYLMSSKPMLLMIIQ